MLLFIIHRALNIVIARYLSGSWFNGAPYKFQEISNDQVRGSRPELQQRQRTITHSLTRHLWPFRAVRSLVQSVAALFHCCKSMRTYNATTTSQFETHYPSSFGLATDPHSRPFWQSGPCGCIATMATSLHGFSISFPLVYACVSYWWDMFTSVPRRKCVAQTVLYSLGAHDLTLENQIKSESVIIKQRCPKIVSVSCVFGPEFLVLSVFGSLLHFVYGVRDPLFMLVLVGGYISAGSYLLLVSCKWSNLALIACL